MDRSLSEIAAMGYQLVVVTDTVTAQVIDAADQVIEAYPRDVDAVMSQVGSARIRSVVGVLSLGYENPPVISRLCERFGTPGLPFDVALNCTDKTRRIRLLDAAGIRVPRYRTADNMRDALQAFEEIGEPAVVKPADLTSSIGVSLLHSGSANHLIREAFNMSPAGRVVVEEYLEGTEHTIEGVRQHGQVSITGVSDRNYSDKLRFAPYFFENGDTLPSSLPSTALEDLITTCVAAVDTLDLDPAVFSCDTLRTTDGESVILEVAARMAGSRFGTEIVPLSTGVNVLPSAVRLAVDEPLQASETAPNSNRPVVLRYLASSPGLVTTVDDLPARTPNGVYDLFWENRPQPGQRLQPYRSGKDMIAGVIASGNSLAEAELIAARALAEVPLTIEDQQPNSCVR
ncbi:ATP-grasp domain-containing protein [Nocardia brevicatena]|uniref:ATP-grasp domain-containing protein n=1 Tax=Nocardia brevicatena TaxID=37327 RepID=UPI0006875400|nr:ATP-grasp domain-containing protein [Nocardia brevicatena]